MMTSIVHAGPQDRRAVGHHADDDGQERGDTPDAEQQRDHPGDDHWHPDRDDADGQQRGLVYDNRLRSGSAAAHPPVG